MKNIIMFISFFFIGCSQKEIVEIYCTNMLYACDCPNYRIDSLTSIKENKLQGKEVYLEFDDKKLQKEFENNTGATPICFKYKFDGYLKTNNVFIVQKYVLIPIKDCND